VIAIPLSPSHHGAREAPDQEDREHNEPAGDLLQAPERADQEGVRALRPLRHRHRPHHVLPVTEAQPLLRQAQVSRADHSLRVSSLFFLPIERIRVHLTTKGVDDGFLVCRIEDVITRYINLPEKDRGGYANFLPFCFNYFTANTYSCADFGDPCMQNCPEQGGDVPDFAFRLVRFLEHI
jgi:hypothetical protein